MVCVWSLCGHFVVQLWSDVSICEQNEQFVSQEMNVVHGFSSKDAPTFWVGLLSNAAFTALHFGQHVKSFTVK